MVAVVAVVSQLRRALTNTNRRCVCSSSNNNNSSSNSITMVLLLLLLMSFINKNAIVNGFSTTKTSSTLSYFSSKNIIIKKEQQQQQQHNYNTFLVQQQGLRQEEKEEENILHLVGHERICSSSIILLSSKTNNNNSNNNDDDGDGDGDDDDNNNEEDDDEIVPSSPYLDDIDGLGSLFSSKEEEEELISFSLNDIKEQQQSKDKKETSTTTSSNTTNSNIQEERQPQQQSQQQQEKTVASNTEYDLSGCQYRRFTLGTDISITNYIGSLGFEEITDWNYYETTYDIETKKEIERKKVDANPLDPINQPKRTRSKSGSLIRVFVGNFVGPLSAQIRSKGYDTRILIKEYQNSKTVKDLAQKELMSMSKLQSYIIDESKHSSNDAKDGLWTAQALDRSMGNSSDDNKNLIEFIELVTQREKVSFVSLLGVLDFGNDEELIQTIDSNEWYRAFGITPPKVGSKWYIYEYCGLQTLRKYAVPPQLRSIQQQQQQQQSNRPIRNNSGGGGGFFGSLFSTPRASTTSLPSYKERINYVVNGIMYQCLDGLATIHEAGLIHGSIGMESIILSSTTFDKLETSQVTSTAIQKLRIVYSDFGFSRSIVDTISDENFMYRAKQYGLNNPKGLQASSFAIAEDLYALGYVFLGLLLTSLAESSSDGMKQQNISIPPTGEDQLQKLLYEIFSNNFDEFRNYCLNEDIWIKVVTEVLDEHNGAGWKLLKELCLARETVVATSDKMKIITARGILDSSLFFDINRKRKQL